METKLSTLVGEWRQVADMMLDPEADQQTVLDTLDGISGEIEVKAEGYGHVIRKLELEAAGLKGKKEYVKGILDQIAAEEKRINSHIDWLKDRLMEAMIATGMDEKGIKTESFEFGVKTAGGVAKLVTEDDVPEEFLKKTVVIEKDNDKIREYLKDHDVDWARLLPKKRSLTIKGV